MGRRRRTSKVLEKAQLRAAGIDAIGADIDLGNGLTGTAYKTRINAFSAKQSAYNQALAALDEQYNDLLAEEKELGDMTERMLAGVAARYGKNSSQYEQAGGVRKDERKSRPPQATPSKT